MKIIKYSDQTSSIKLVPESFEDLYLLARIISPDDVISSKSYRRFKPSEGDTGEQKEVFVKLILDKLEIDRSAGRLRLTGKIEEARPEEFVRLGTYHTINIGPGDALEIAKPEWREYILKRIKQAVQDGKRPRLGIIVMDDEKATVAYIMGYGIEIKTEIYSKLSKKMKEKDFEKQRTVYFNELLDMVSRMDVEMVIMAGPGFTKDDLKKYIEANGIKINRKLFYASASDAERSGIREVMQSPSTSKILESEHVKTEFHYLNLFFDTLRTGKAIYGPEKVKKALEEYQIGAVIVNDSVINGEQMKELLDAADKSGVHIEIFNSEDEAGKQLAGFKDIAGIDKALLK